MPDILTRADKSYTEILKGLQSKPHTVYAGRYYCLRVGYIWYLQETHCRNCGTQITHFEQGKENSLPAPENAVERDSGSSSPIPADSATPETIRISLPALRSLTMGILDNKALYLQHLFHADEAEANEAREMFCDGLEAAIREVQRRFNG